MEAKSKSFYLKLMILVTILCFASIIVLSEIMPVSGQTQLWSYPTESAARHVLISTDGSKVVVGTDSGMVRGFLDGALIWSSNTDGYILSMDMPDDGRYVAVASQNGNLYFLNGNDGELLSPAKNILPTALDATPNGNYLAVLPSGPFVLWFSETGEFIANLTIPIYNAEEISISDDGSYVAISGGRFVHLLRRQDGFNWTSTGVNPEAQVLSVDISDSYVAYGTSNRDVEVRDISGNLLWNRPIDNQVKPLQISADQQYIIACTGDHGPGGTGSCSIYLIDLNSGLPLWAYPVSFSNVVYDVAISPSNSYIVAGSSYALNFLDGATGELLSEYMIESPILSVSIASNGSYFVAGTSNGISAFSMPIEEYSLSIEVDGSGYTTPGAGDSILEAGSEFTVIAYPDEGWFFSHWLLDEVDVGTGIAIDSQNWSYTVAMDTDHILTAVFSPIPPQTLTIEVFGSGTTVPNPGEHTFEQGSTVIVEAFPEADWNFGSWRLDGAEVGNLLSYSIVMDTDHVLVAVFEEKIPTAIFYDLRISLSGSGSTNPAPEITSIQSGTIVTVTATPDPNWRFSHWLLDGENVGSNPNYRIQMDDNHELTAVFEPEENGNGTPHAVIDLIEPSSGGESAVQGEIISFRGSGYDDGYIVEYRWTSDIDGLLSSSEDFTTSSLSVGLHKINFEVMDNHGQWSNLATQTLRVEGGVPLGIIGGVAGAIFIPSVGFGTYHFYYKNRLPQYPRTYFNKSPSSNQVKEIQKEKTQKSQEKEEEEKKKYKRRRKKGKPFLSLELKIPANVSKLESYEAKLVIKNEGQSKATDIKIGAVATRGLTLDNPPDGLTSLKQGESKTFDFPFKVDKFAKKGVYTIRFNVDCKETSSRQRRGYTRAVKIGLLSNPENPNSLIEIKNWLDQNSYSWNEMTESCDKINSLFAYDLLIIPPELKMPSRWVNNISTFVENSQSILLIDKVITTENDVLAETLGYSKMQFESLKMNKTNLKISKEHSITKGFVEEEKLPLFSCWGNPCTQSVSTGAIVAEFYDKNAPKASIPAITYNKFYDGKTVHLNFHAEEHIKKLDPILKNSIEYLI